MIWSSLVPLIAGFCLAFVVCSLRARLHPPGVGLRVFANSGATTSGGRTQAPSMLEPRTGGMRDGCRRVATELHDHVAQELTGISMALVQLVCCDEASAAGAELRAFKAIVDGCIQRVRTTAYLLHPPALGTTPLGELGAYVDGYSKRSGIETAFLVEGSLAPMPQAWEGAVVRIVQECLLNVYRHSAAPRATVRLTATPEALEIAVADAGRGIPPDRLRRLARGSASEGLGLATMRERAAELGGTLHLESGAAGTTVRVTLPVQLVPC